MQCGLYGKLSTKRDFVALGVPREVLTAWEPWLQGGISASRTTLGKDWQAAFLTAPIWRFWLGADLCGRSVLGAFMPSSDGIGRYFPLTLFALADENAMIAPPEFEAQDGWFKHAEDFLISTLDEHKTFEAIVDDLNGLAAPSQEPLQAPTPDMTLGPDGTVAILAGERDFAEIFKSVRENDHGKVYASTTYWWTIGGDGFAPMALCGKRMPDPFLFSVMLTGKFPASERG
jgi:type VI secretion system protein ImpM